MEQKLAVKAAEDSQRLTVWAKQVAECRNSGLSVKEWCEKNSIAEKTYYYRQHKVYSAAVGQQNFVKVEVDSKETTRESAKITINGISAEIYAGATRETIAEIISAMKHAQ